jgi:ubiquinone/menaquinone biosynthesis C-methylase UbiE
MPMLIPERRFDERKPEMVDMPDADPELLRGELRNLRIINRYFGGLSTVRNAVMPMVLETHPRTTVVILDLATGSGDQPVAIARKLRKLGRRTLITAVDRNETVIAEARRHAAGFDEIRFEIGDIRSLPCPDGSFDIVLCSLALHHFAWPAGVHLLGEMNRLSRIGFVVNDLSRSYLALAGTWLYTRATTTNIMTKTDAIASIRAAYTKEELNRMAVEAGIRGMEVYLAPFFRLVGVKRKTR